MAGRVAGASLASAPTSRTSATAAAAAVATRVPNDPNLPFQYWNYNMIGLPRAWAITTGSAAVTVAVLDMGVRFDDTGIAANLTADGYDFVSKVPIGFTEDGTMPLCDVDSVVKTIDGDGDGPDADPTDPNDLEQDFSGCWFQSTAGDHGLWTSGIIGELGNNGAGGTGINWTVKIRPVRVLGITGEGTSFDIAQGILYAAGLPAAGAGGAMVQAPSRSPILSISLGGSGSSMTEQNAVAAAVAAGSLIIASAGNSTSDLPSYPAAYPGVMGVAAVGPDGTIASYSNAGAYISVAAPGGEPRLDSDFDNDTGGDWVWGRWWDFTRNRAVFTAAVGTSASAPHVSGVAALILAQNPTLTAAQLRQRIEQFATRAAGTTRSNNYGWGIVNAYNSLTQTNGPPTQTYVRLIDATSGAVVKTATVNATGAFSLTQLATGAYYLQAGDDEGGDATIGLPGRRFSWAGSFGTPTVFNVTATTNTQAAAILLEHSDGDRAERRRRARQFPERRQLRDRVDRDAGCARRVRRHDSHGRHIHVRDVGRGGHVRVRSRARHDPVRGERRRDVGGNQQRLHVADRSILFARVGDAYARHLLRDGEWCDVRRCAFARAIPVGGAIGNVMRDSSRGHAMERRCASHPEGVSA